VKEKYLILFDGVCNFCNGAVEFIIKRDPDGVFVFSPIQSDHAKRILTDLKIDNVSIDSFMLIKSGVCYSHTNAALEITRDLTGLWPIARVLIFIPKFIRDYFYRLLARNRYALFGRKSQCMIPTEEFRSRFVGL